MEIKEKKKKIRKIIRELKKGASADSLMEKSLAIQKLVEEMDGFKKSKTLLLYYSLPDEVNTEYLIKKYSNRLGGDKRVILPVVQGDYLILKEFVPNEISSGYQNILEPEGDEIISPQEIEFAVIPGVGFDNKCNRMGRGKGFYDRLLPQLNCKCVGLGFGFQMVGSIPCEEFDKPLDSVATEDGIIYKL